MMDLVRMRMLVILSVPALVLGTCGSPATTTDEPTEPTTAQTSNTPVHWDYHGDAGPANWGSLSPDYAMCSAGKGQSPIDIIPMSEIDLANIAFSYQSSKLNILNNGHTVQVNYDKGSYIEFDGRRFELVQFHFHTPSEHSIEGQAADAELHLVHRAGDGSLAVVGVLIRRGSENAALALVWPHLPATEGPEQTIDSSVNADALLPQSRTTFRYSGSLTTPPCSEGVSWLVMTEPIELSEEQLATLRNAEHINNRPIQPGNNRPVVEDVTA
jgi:carbonic anhydrase